MEDQMDRGPYKMALDNTDDQIEESEFELDPTDDVMEDDGFDAESAHEEWDEQDSSDGFFKRYGALLGFLVVGAALVWLLFNWIGTTRQIANISGSSEMESQLQQLESRIVQLEQRPQLEPSPQPESSTAPQPETVDTVTKDDLQRLSNRIDQLESMVNNLRTQGASSTAKKPVTVAAKKKTTPPKKVAAAKSSVKAMAGYTVQKGDTLYGIAIRKKVSVDQLKKWNGLTGNALNVGQKLKIAP